MVSDDYEYTARYDGGFYHLSEDLFSGDHIHTGGLFFVRLPWIMVITVKYHSVRTLLTSYPLAWCGTLACLIPYYFYRKKITLQEDIYK